MGYEYKIACAPPKDEDLAILFSRLPSPIDRKSMREIYNYRIEEDGFYFVDYLVSCDVAAVALRVFLDAALSTTEKVTISEP